MLSRMAPSSPPEKRTLHLLKTPDILCANDNRPTGSYSLVSILRLHPELGDIDDGSVRAAPFEVRFNLLQRFALGLGQQEGCSEEVDDRESGKHKEHG